MGLLSLLQFGQQASPLAALTQQQATPQMGFEWQNPSMLPQAPQVPQGAAAFTPNKQATPGEGTPPGGWMSRLQSGMESPLFNLGMALMAGSQNGGDWGVVSDSLRGYGQDQRERQRLANEERAAKAQQNLQNTQFDWMRTDRQRADEQRQRYTNWASNQSDNPDASVDPEAAFRATQEARGIASQPITPYQQAQLDLESRGQSLNYSAQIANLNRDRPLRGPDASLLTDVREAAARLSALTQLGGSFMELNGPGGTGTGPDRRFNPFNQFDSGYQTMNSIVSQMIPFMRAPGSGATSDYEQQLYQRGVQSPTNSPTANQAIWRNQQTLANLAQQRRYFYEDYASQNGTLNGAEQAFQASPQFQQITRANPIAPAARAPANAPAGGVRQPAAGGTSITPEQARAELARRDRERRQSGAYGQQPGGYTGR